MFSFGRTSPALQQFDASAKDLDSLLKSLPRDQNPFANWKPNRIASASDITSWFPPADDQNAVFQSFLDTDKEDTTRHASSSLTYADLHECAMRCPDYYHRMHRDHNDSDALTVAVLMPPNMMAEMGVVLVSLLAKPNVCVAPLDPSMSPSKLCEALEQLQCRGIVTTRELWSDNRQPMETHFFRDHREEEKDLHSFFRDIRIVESTGVKVGAVRWTILHQQEPLPRILSDDAAEKEHFATSDPFPLEAEEEETDTQRPVLLLRTSGTTSVPKVVPLTASSLLYNATCIAASLQLQRDDVGCNAMPLFHIGGVSCALLSVLVSGSSVVMMGQFNPEAFLDCLMTTTTAAATAATPTWYYGVPTMHKTLTLTAQARLLRQEMDPKNSTTTTSGDRNFIPNKLRFIRSGAAHLPHETAVDLSKVFRARVIPTYSMSEAMPICSQHKAPVVWNGGTGSGTNTSNHDNRETVGEPIGCSLRIIDELGNALPYGKVGEVALFGPGVIKAYSGGVVDPSDSHTPDGWLRTGDIGELDRSGILKLKGRLKEMIKRGGEQVWPNEVDTLIERVPGVLKAVTFGVPNDLWGEEVAVAVVLSAEQEQVATGTIDDRVAVTRRLILDTCNTYLDSAAVPSQIVFVPSTDSLLKGPTGKYLRTRLADHLQVKPVDTGALHLLKGMARAGTDDGDENEDKERISATRQQGRVVPSSALNGLRLITACFVVQNHVGLYPNDAWLKIQSYTLDMQIFFMLGGFQLACSIKNSVLKHWAEWVGTKIGTMHALFVVTQLVALPSQLLFQCGPNGYQEQFENQNCQHYLKSFIPLFVINTATAMAPREDSENPPSWFQTAFYMFLVLFPPLDAHLRSQSDRGLAWRLVLSLAIATLYFVLVPQPLGLLCYAFPGWLPTLVAAMIAGYYFSRHATVADEEEQNSSTCSATNNSALSFRNPRVQGIITDLLSIVFLLCEVIVALSPSCAYVQVEDYMELRPGEAIPDESLPWANTTYVYTCELTDDEFVEYVHSQPDELDTGRWETKFGDIVGWCRVGTPLVLLWLYSMAHGRGFTVRLLNMKVFQWLSPLAYPLYLLHVPIGRYYWIATRGLEAEYWWWEAALFPFPVQWYEAWLIIAICLVLGGILDRFVVSFLSRYTVSLGVKICQWISSHFFCYCPRNRRDDDDAEEEASSSASSSCSSNLEKVQSMVKRMTGIHPVPRSTNLRDLGLDSLGATALMGTLRVSVPAARKLTMANLASFETVGDLVDALDALDSNDEDREIRTKDTEETEEIEGTNNAVASVHHVEATERDGDPEV